jgi:hypothetical protein
MLDQTSTSLGGTDENPAETESIESLLRRKFVEAVTALQDAAHHCYVQGNKKDSVEALTHINNIAL